MIPTFAVAQPGTRVPVLNCPVGGARLDPVQGKVPYRGRPAFEAPKAAPAVWYGVVGADGVARSLRATFAGKPGTNEGRWLDAGDAPLPSGVLLFDSAPACRGWMVAHMGATCRGFTEPTGPIGSVP